MRLLLFLFFTSLTFNVFSQDLEEINTDRPDQSEGIYTLQPKQLQIENGITFTEHIVANNFMLRYGLWKGTELRLLNDISINNKKQWQIDNVFVSLKQRLISENKWIPSITLVGYGGYDFTEKYFKPNVCLAFENTLSDKFLLVYNIGVADKFQNTNATLQLGYSPEKNLYVFVEYFGVFNNQIIAQHNIDSGVLFMLSSNFQLDIAFGHSLFRTPTDFFVTTGFSYRF